MNLRRFRWPWQTPPEEPTEEHEREMAKLRALQRDAEARKRAAGRVGREVEELARHLAPRNSKNHYSEQIAAALRAQQATHPKTRGG